MKLKLHAIDYVENTISFKVPNELMIKAFWEAGYAEIDISKICVDENNKPVERDG